MVQLPLFLHRWKGLPQAITVMAEKRCYGKDQCDLRAVKNFLLRETFHIKIIKFQEGVMICLIT